MSQNHDYVEEWADTNVELTEEEKKRKEQLEKLKKLEKIESRVKDSMTLIDEHLFKIKKAVEDESDLVNELRNEFKRRSSYIMRRKDVLVCIERVRKDMIDLRTAIENE